MVRTYSHSSLHLLLLSLKSSVMARHQGKSGVGKKPSAAKDRKTKDSHIDGGQKSKTILIQDDPVSEELDKAYLGSIALDICLLDHSYHNQSINHTFCAKLQESFQHGVQRFTQEDQIKATITPSDFTLLLQDYYHSVHTTSLDDEGGDGLLDDIRTQVKMHTSQLVGYCTRILTTVRIY